tara:strand:+ start:106 stop:312 length:207 start_codon:yes stop_codon:yes gene_type:complete
MKASSMILTIWHLRTGLLEKKGAIDYYEKALKVNKKAENVYRVLKDFKNLSKIYKSMGNKEKAENINN